MAEKVEVLITGKDELSGVLGGLTSGLMKFGNIGLGLAAGGLAVLGAGLVGVGKILGDSVQEAMEAQNVLSQLNQVIESTGGIAGVTAEQATNLASELQKVTRFSDETIIGGENLLLTFTNIGKDVFPLATETMLDMSQALGQDLKGSAIQLGKALQDPIMGVTALRRVGVNFTEEQKELIKTLVETGRLEEAQAIILKELQVEFGGSARAAGETFAGQLDILKNRFSEIKETIGMKLMPVLTNLFGKLSDWLSSPEIQANIEKIVEWFGKFADQVGIVIDAVSAGGLMEFFQTFEDGSSYVGGFLELLGMTEESAYEWGATINTVVADVQAAWSSIATAFKEDEGLIVATLAVVGATFAAFAVGIAISAATAMAPLLPIIAIIAAIGVAAYVLYTAWNENWGGVQEKLTAVWNAIQPSLQTLMTWLQTNIPVALQKLSNFWTGVLLPALTAVWSWISSNLIPMWSSIANLVGTVVGGAFALWMAGLTNVTLPVLKRLYDFFVVNILPTLQKIASWIMDKVVVAFGRLTDRIGWVTDKLKTLNTWLQSLKLPKWLTPGSPTPFELGLLGIADALDIMSKIPVLDDIGSIRSPMSGMGGGLSPATVGMGGGGGIQINLTYAPALSLGDRSEVQSKLLPMIIDGVRKAKADGMI